MVTTVYDPPWGKLDAARRSSRASPSSRRTTRRQLRRAMDDVADEAQRAPALRRLHAQRAPRRAARRDVYGDDIGLSASRARRTMEMIQAEMGLEPAQVEHEGRGFVHSDDVVNAGFFPGETRPRRGPGRLRRARDASTTTTASTSRRSPASSRPKNPLALNLMRITVDGEPIDDPGRSSADIQRCTDVALEQTEHRLPLRRPRVEAPALRDHGGADRAPVAADDVGRPPVRFRMYTNYAHFIERSEVRIFRADESTRGDATRRRRARRAGLATWTPDPAAARVDGRRRGLADDAARAPDVRACAPTTRTATSTRRRRNRSGCAPGGSVAPLGDADAADPELLAGYGEIRAAGARTSSSGAPAGARRGQRHSAGAHGLGRRRNRCPSTSTGEFVGEVLLPSGLHTVEVAVLDQEGNGELFLRDLELEQDDWF